MYHLRMWDFLCIFARFLLQAYYGHLIVRNYEKVIRFDGKYAVGLWC